MDPGRRAAPPEVPGLARRQRSRGRGAGGAVERRPRLVTPKPAGTVTISGITVELSNTGKVLFPESAITKGDVVGYYQDAARRMLPYLRDRPLVMARYPDGITGERIFQKNVPRYF